MRPGFRRAAYRVCFSVWLCCVRKGYARFTPRTRRSFPCHSDTLKGTGRSEVSISRDKYKTLRWLRVAKFCHSERSEESFRRDNHKTLRRLRVAKFCHSERSEESWHCIESKILRSRSGRRTSFAGDLYLLRYLCAEICHSERSEESWCCIESKTLRSRSG